MGRCEKERADFNQEADHLSIRLAKFGDSRPRLPRFVFAHGHAHHHTPAQPALSAPPLLVLDSNTMLFGPLGPSLAPYVRSSRTLSKWLKPIASWYANLAGYRKVGLVYDDLRASRSSSSTPSSNSAIVFLWLIPSSAHIFFLVVEERPDVQRVRISV